ncbi:MAG: zinc dependent phospholipase C family protein [Candidatus Cloacimonadota bacterium]|nr:zinc dependent phospholipase C family protein [Candidatus Cloacimonadota bacterium]
MIWKWNPSTHIKMCRLALTKMSPRFNRLIDVYPEYFELGIIAPDKIFGDTTNHYYNCTPNAKGYHYGSVVKKIQKETILIHKILFNKNSLVYHPKCAGYLKKIIDNPLKIIVFELGVISHYVADLHQPFHTDGKYRFEYEEVPHKVYEADVRKNFGALHLNIGKRRYRIKSGIDEYFYSQIYKSNKYYDKLVDSYFLSPNKVKPDRWETSIYLTEDCVSRAVKSTANIWFLFEEEIRQYKKQIRHCTLMAKLHKNIDLKCSYYLKVYPSGTLSLRKN